ncbi:MAG TPA: alpha/beta fold hydrolase, partial [Vicinamibacterales bacterium]|nr:alpha/beta fold hydrolase [Vicinamibacterales bacterium]
MIRTEDGVTLAGTWYEPAARPAPAVVLVHMLLRSRRDWDLVAARLAQEGIGALAIDLRGQGDSLGSAQDYSAMVADVRAARRFLLSRAAVSQGRVGLGGASLGASLVLLAAADDPTVSSVAMLSPALDYRGVRIEAAARKYGTRQLLLVAGDDDPYALRSARELQGAASATRQLLVLSHAGHGTMMLLREPGLTAALVDWF